MKLPFEPYLLIFNFYEQFSQSPFLKFALIALGAFIFIFLLGLVRQHVFKISMRGAVFGFALGVILVLVLDLIILAALADKVKLQTFVSGEKRQETFGEIFATGVTNLNQFLGFSTIGTPRKPKTAQEVMGSLLSLPDEEAQKVKNLVCP